MIFSENGMLKIPAANIMPPIEPMPKIHKYKRLFMMPLMVVKTDKINVPLPASP
jgi:hypothetical protein